MSETEDSGPESRGEEADSVLRAKYLDYCSAQVADTLVQLSPDEMYVLAEAAVGEEGVPTDLSYAQVVQLATERVSRDLDLPPFEEWVKDYRAHPERYDDQLLGLWESGLEGGSGEG